MSCDCLSKYHGRASRDALRVWSGWASTVIHGPRYKQDYWLRFEPDNGQCYAPGRRATPRVRPPGRSTRPAAGPRYASGRRAAPRAGSRAVQHTRPTTAPPRRWTFRPTDGRRRYIPMDIEDPRPWSLQPDSCTVRWDYARGSDSVCWSLLYTAGQDNSGRVIHLHLLGPAAILGSGPGREEQRGSTRGGTGGRRRLRRAEPGRAGP